MSRKLVLPVCFAGFVLGALVFPAFSAELPDATQALLEEYQGLKAMLDGERLVAFYGVPMEIETNQAVSTDDFVEDFVFDDLSRFGFEGLEIHAAYDSSYSIRDQELSVYTYHQEMSSDANEDTLPVHGSLLRVLVLHAPNGDRKVTYVGMNLFEPPSEDFDEDTVTTGSGAITIVSNSEDFDHLDTFTAPELVVYQDAQGVLHRAWRFFGADDDDAEEEYRFFVDAASEEILSARSSVLHADVAGHVTGATTANPLAEEVELPMPWVEVGLYEPSGPLGACGIGDLVAEDFADEDGWFGFDVTLPVRVLAVLDSDVATVVRREGFYFYPIVTCEDVEAATTDLEVVFDATPSSDDVLGTAAMNAYSVIHKSHNFWEVLQPPSDAADVHVWCSLNNEGCVPQSGRHFSIPTIGLTRDSQSCHNSAYSTIVSHEYMHVIQGQMFGETALDILSFIEGTADVFSAFLWRTPVLGEAFWPDDDPIRNIDTPDVVNPGAVCTASSTDDYVYVCGSALAGAFWDMRQNFIDDEVPAAEKSAATLMADFMMVTDGQWDDSFVAELLAVDDDDGTLANGTPHSDQIAPAFTAHGFFSPLCTESNCGDVVVEWTGPTSSPSQENGDYTVNESIVPPVVTLHRREKGGAAVLTWRIGRESGGDVAAVVADWDTNDPGIHDVVAVEVGTIEGAPIRNLNVVDVAAQGASKYVNVRLLLTGDLRVRARAYVSNDDRGGRISGTVAGDARFIGAEAVGEGASSPGELEIGGTLVNADFGFVPANSVLTVDGIGLLVQLSDDLSGSIEIEGDLAGQLHILGSGAATSLITVGGDVVNAAGVGLFIDGDIAGDIDIEGDLDGYVIIDGTFTGDVCAANIFPGEELPSGLQVTTFGTGASFCGADYCTQSSQCPYAEDHEWCTVDTCQNNACIAVCTTRPYGDVKINNLVNLDDIMAVNAAYSGTFTNCGNGTKSGCDVWNSTTAGCSPQDELIHMDDILKVVAAFSANYACTSPCDCGDSMMGGGSESESAAEGPLDAASQIIGYLAEAVETEDMPEQAIWSTGDALAIWCLETMSESEIADVVPIAEEALGSAAADLNVSILETLIGELK